MKPRPPSQNSADTLRVLHVITTLDVGGAEVALKKLVLGDPLRGDRHVVVSLKDIGPIGRDLEAAGVTVHALHMQRRYVGGFLSLIRLIKRLKPSVVQTWLYHGDLIGGLAARAAGRRAVIWGLHNARFVRGQTRLTVLVMRLCAILSPWLPRVIVCCAEAARVAHVGWGYQATRMRVIPNGFELPDLREIGALRDAARAELGIQPELIVVGIVARFDPTKDHESFLKAAAIIARRNSLVRFMLVGRGVDERNDFLMRLVREGELEGRCMLLGERREVQRFYAAMDVFCLCSVYEAFPLVLGEAMAMALPCVVTDAGDARRIVGGTGRIIPPGRPNELAEALGEAIEMSPDDRRAVGLAARRRIEMEFSMAQTRRLFEQAYLDACVSSD